MARYGFQVDKSSPYLTRVAVDDETKGLRSQPVPRDVQPICAHKIGPHSWKPSHVDPIRRLPHEFRRLAGAATTIFETTHNEGLASLAGPL